MGRNRRKYAGRHIYSLTIDYIYLRRGTSLCFNDKHLHPATITRQSNLDKQLLTGTISRKAAGFVITEHRRPVPTDRRQPHR